MALDGGKVADAHLLEVKTEDALHADLLAMQLGHTRESFVDRKLVFHDAGAYHLLQTGKLSGQVAPSELPQHALDLPAPKEGDAQAVRLLTSIAERAVKGGGLEALRSDRSWASFLENDRIPWCWIAVASTSRTIRRCRLR